jgi:peptide-methionine (R)-S-oxide reductase
MLVFQFLMASFFLSFDHPAVGPVTSFSFYEKAYITRDTIKPIRKSDKEWKEILSPQAYYILRKSGTERAFTGKLYATKEKGTYVCGGCQLPLFSSETKFNSGTGWPSFWQPINKKNVKALEDYEFGMVRTEIRCARCDGHIGHVFDDGPKPTGLRYCMNSEAMLFQPAEKKK